MIRQTIPELLRQLKIETAEAGQHEHAREGWIQIDCPWCRSGTFRLGINLKNAYSNCWLCGSHTLFDTLHTACKTNIDKRELTKALKGIPRDYTPQRRHTGSLSLPSGVVPLQTAHLSYLKERKLEPQAVSRRWKIQGISHLGGQLSWRLFIPIHRHGKIVSWTTRAIGDKTPRYLTARPDQESISAKHLLYGNDAVTSCTVIVHEGPVDVWSTGPGSVATLGASYTYHQLASIANYPQRYICFDNEPEAQKRAKKLCNDLSVVAGITKNILLETGKDSAEIDTEELKQLKSLLKNNDNTWEETQ